MPPPRESREDSPPGPAPDVLEPGVQEDPLERDHRRRAPVRRVLEDPRSRPDHGLLHRRLRLPQHSHRPGAGHGGDPRRHPVLRRHGDGHRVGAAPDRRDRGGPGADRARRQVRDRGQVDRAAGDGLLRARATARSAPGATTSTWPSSRSSCRARRRDDARPHLPRQGRHPLREPTRTRRRPTRTAPCCGSSARRSAARTCTSTTATCPCPRPASPSATSSWARSSRSAAPCATSARGDRVLCSGVIGCGLCAACRGGHVVRCERRHVARVRHERATLPGGQAEAVAVPGADHALRRIPDGVSVEQAVLLTDILPTAFYGARNAEIRPGQTVAVIGLGPGRPAAPSSARSSSAPRACSRSTASPSASPRRGARRDPVARATDARRARPWRSPAAAGPDAVIEAVGADATIQLALQLVRVGGRRLGGRRQRATSPSRSRCRSR